MPIFPGSRHQLESKFTNKYENNQDEVRTVSWLTLRVPFATKDFPDNTTVIFSQGDTLHAIAHKVYGDPQYWWVIAEFNNILDPTPKDEGGELFAGLILVIPTAERLFSTLLNEKNREE